MPGLDNVVAFAAGLLSGSAPHREGGRPAGLDTLRSLGVRTVISVDAAPPEADAAAARGLRYVHLPIGYDGIPPERCVELARAARDALRAGPVYVHCHHGKHRSAAAAAVIAVALGMDDADAMLARMRVSGTSEHYAGLYACAADASMIPPAALDAIDGEFPSVLRPEGLVAAMVEADHALAHLRTIEAAGWRTPPEHPDLVPAADAGRLADALRVSAEDDDSRGATFATMMVESAEAASVLEQMLLDRATPARLAAQLERVAQSCIECHRAHRD